MQQELLKQDQLVAPNVSQCPQYSPFRYPGGKTWLYPFAKKWLLSYPNRTLIEPFAGGGYVSLTAAIEKLAEQITMVELDKNVAAVWETIFSDKHEWLCNQIDSLDLTHENVDAIIEKTDNSVYDRGFATLLTNRIVRGGILAPGSGRIKYGENGKGIKSRWYPETLVKRIEKIAKSRDRVQFIHGDGFEIIENNTDDRNALLFVDPPYPKAGRRLYSHYKIDDEGLFELLDKVSGNFLLTYDNSELIQDLVNQFNFESEKILMSTTHHRKKYELLISKDLSWLY
jgi:DNA adenine methylase